MEFEVLYNRIIVLWPESIDISDGCPTGDSGFRFPTLSECWDDAEEKIDPLVDPWGNIGVWAFFQAFHETAKKGFQEGETVLSTREVSKESINERIIENLNAGDWEQERSEYKSL